MRFCRLLLERHQAPFIVGAALLGSTVSPDVTRFAAASNFYAFVVSGALSGVAMTGAAVVILRTGVFPRWLGWVGALILRDSEVTKVFIVTLAETTPVLEAQTLQEDLRQAGIEPFAWVINASLLAAQVTDPVLQQRAYAEVPLIRRVAGGLAQRVALVPFQVSEPTGAARLREMAGANQSTARTIDPPA